jgi:hypothetical protein
MALEDIGRWLVEIESEEDLTHLLMNLLEEHGPSVSLIQKRLREELEGENGDRLSKQLTWFDAQFHYVGGLQAEADALLDLADRFFLIQPGRSVPCTTEDGRQVPATGSKGKPGDEGWNPKFKELTDIDRNTYSAAKCVPYRRLRNEFKVMGKALEGRMWLGKMLLGELQARHKASGLV